MKILVKENCHIQGMPAFVAGTECDVASDIGSMLIERGHAEEAHETKKTKTTHSTK